MDLSKGLAETNADVAHFLFEALGGAALIRAFGAEELERKRLEQKHSQVLKYLLRFQVLGAFSGSVPMSFMVVNTLVVFGYGGYLVLDDTLSIGALVAFSIYQGRVFAPLQGMMDGFLSAQKSKVALARVKEILDVEPAYEQSGSKILGDGQLRGAIAFQNVSFAYEPKEPVLTNQSFHIPAGKITAIVGPSGVGKTTVCHLILRLFDPDAGAITLDGIDLKEFETSWLRTQVSLVSQDTFLFHTSILENIAYSKPGAAREEIVEAARAACIHEFIETLPDGYDTVIGDRGIRLSGGQRQRISIARSILLDPRILILDEATAFLDSEVEERLRDTMRSLMEERTILVVSHRASTVQGAENIITLSNDPHTNDHETLQE
jgi:ABC-type multidrug transport system fused ATPase/permease subunit